MAVMVPIFFLFAETTREQRLEDYYTSNLDRVVVLPEPAERPLLVPVPYFEDFESGPGGWTQTAFTVYCQWQRMTDPELTSVHPDIYGDMVVFGDPAPANLPSAHSGRNCWWYGSPENGTFIGEPFDHFPLFPYSGGNSYVNHGGYLTSPLFETSALPSITFSFWTWWEVECIDIDQYDMMFIEVSSDAGATWDTINWLNPPFARLPGWDGYESYSSGGWLESGIWIKWTYFLETEWTGHDIMVRFEFDTRDNLYNGFRGWMIDDVYVSGGIEEPRLQREGSYPESLAVADCDITPNPFPFDFEVTNTGGEAAFDVILDLELPPNMSISSGFDIVTLGTVLPDDIRNTHWELLIDPIPLYDTTICWEVILTSADSLIGYIDDFEGDDRLFTGSGGLDYCDVRRSGGPDEAISGLGVAGIPSSGPETEYGELEHAFLTSETFNIAGWTEAYIGFWYWLDVHYNPIWTTDGEDGFLVEYQIDGGSWEQLDEFGVGILIPRYDAYIDEWVENPLANRMTYCEPTDGEWVEVVSQNLIEMGVVSPGDDIRFRFIFASDDTLNGEGFFIDDFRLSTHQYPVGPYLHTFCMDVPGLHTPNVILVMPLDSSSSSCPDQSLVINTGGEALIDTYGVIIRADDTIRYAFEEGNMMVDTDNGVVIATPNTGQYWSEGWHNIALDTCFNILGCNLDSTLHWSFLSDRTPPEIALVDPPGGVFHNEVSAPTTANIEDTLTGVGSSTLAVIYCGETYEYPHSALTWDGSEFTFYPESTGTGLTWEDCGEFCVIAGDDPVYCEPNADTVCFPIIIDFSTPWAELVLPPTGSITACEYQDIVIDLFDSTGIYQDGAELVVDGVRHVSGISSEIVIEYDRLVYTPFMRWNHNDTVNFALELFYNIHGTPNTDTLRSYFIVDLEPPEVDPLSPQPGQMQFASDVHIDAGLSDSPAGLDIHTIVLNFMGRAFDLTDLNWSGDDWSGYINLEPSVYGLIPTWGDTFEIEIYICDNPDLCDPNCTTTVWSFHMEPPTVCEAIPNPFSPNGDNINDVVLFDYPHRYIGSATLQIFDIKNVLMYEGNINQERRTWTGKDNFGSGLAPGLYLYIIKKEGRIICNGTVVLVR